MFKSFQDPVLILCFLLFLLVSLLSGFFFLRTPPQIVSVRVRALTQSRVIALAKKEASMAEKTAEISAYAHRLNQVIQQLAQKNHWVVVPEKAVIAGALDVTDQIQQALEKNE